MCFKRHNTNMLVNLLWISKNMEEMNIVARYMLSDESETVPSVIE